MANYQPTHNWSPSHPSENNPKAQSTGTHHPAQHVQGVTDISTPQTLPRQTLPRQTLPRRTHADNEADEAMGPAAGDFRPAAGEFRPAADELENHCRYNFNPIHTCATCKEIAPNNYALERHASNERHKAFLCTCTTKFVRLATLNRHIADQAGPKHHCDYCDDRKGFARSDKLIDHLRTGHKFGEKAVARIRGQIGARPGYGGHDLLITTTANLNLPVSTSVAHHVAPDAIPTTQAEVSKGPCTRASAGPAGILDDGIANLNAVDFQPFSIDGHHLLPGATGALVGFNVSGVEFPGDGFAAFDISGVEFSGADFSDFDMDLDISGMDNGL